MPTGPVYILARIRIRYGQIERFAEIMKGTVVAWRSLYKPKGLPYFVM